MFVIFGAKFQNFELKMHVAVVQRLKLDTEGPKEGLKHSSTVLKTPKNHREPNNVYTLICFSDCVLSLYSSLVMTSKKMSTVHKNAQSTYLNMVTKYIVVAGM